MRNDIFCAGIFPKLCIIFRTWGVSHILKAKQCILLHFKKKSENYNSCFSQHLVTESKICSTLKRKVTKPDTRTWPPRKLLPELWLAKCTIRRQSTEFGNCNYSVTSDLHISVTISISKMDTFSPLFYPMNLKILPPGSYL